MSLYNMMFGYNPLSALVLEALKLQTGDVPRFRDAYYCAEKDNLVIYTRTGGCNREYYGESHEDNLEGPWNSDLESHQNYLHDEDDDYDCTYAYFYFSIPEEFKPIFSTLKELNSGQDLNPTQKFAKLIEDLEAGNVNEETNRALEIGKSLFESMFKSVK